MFAVSLDLRLPSSHAATPVLYARATAVHGTRATVGRLTLGLVIDRVFYPR